MLAEAAVNEPTGTRLLRAWAARHGAFKRLFPALVLTGSRAVTLLAQFSVQVVVGALAGATGLGTLQLFTSWVSMAGEVLAMGLPARGMRQVAVACANGEAHSIEQILRESRQRILRFWLWLTVLLLPVSIWAGLTDGAEHWGDYYWLFIGTLSTAPLFALGRLYSESLKATGAALTAVTLENLLSPLAILSLAAGCWLLSQPLVAVALLMAYGVSVAIIPLVLRQALSLQLARLSPLQAVSGRVASLPHNDLFYLWSTGVLGIAFLQMPFLILPFYVSTAEIGVYSMAHKLVNVITTLLLLMAAVYGPRFARHSEQRNGNGLEKLLRQTQMISLAVYVPAALLLIVLAGPLTSLFGQEFGEMQNLLVILCGGQLINAATGLCGVLLNMSGRASQELKALCITIAFAAIASLRVGPEYGTIGLAFVFSSSIALKNLISYCMVSRALKGMRSEP